MHAALGDDLAVEVGVLLQQPGVLEGDGAAGPGGHGVLVVVDGRAVGHRHAALTDGVVAAGQVLAEAGAGHGAAGGSTVLRGLGQVGVIHGYLLARPAGRGIARREVRLSRSGRRGYR